MTRWEWEGVSRNSSQLLGVEEMCWWPLQQNYQNFIYISMPTQFQVTVNTEINIANIEQRNIDTIIRRLSTKYWIIDIIINKVSTNRNFNVVM